MKGAVVDLEERLKDLKTSLERGVAAEKAGAASSSADASASEVSSMEAALENLIELVEIVDFARDLHAIGGLPVLKDLLSSSQPGLRARAAEVVGTCVQNCVTVQESFYEGGILEALLPLADDSVASVRGKGLFALSCQFRGHLKSLIWLRVHGFRETLVRKLRDEDARVQRKALQMLAAWVRMLARDRRELATGLGALDALLPPLASPDAATREAAFALAANLAADADALRAMQADGRWKQAVRDATVRLDAVSKADWDGVREEAEAILALSQQLARTLPPQPEPTTQSTQPPQSSGSGGPYEGGIVALLPSSS